MTKLDMIQFADKMVTYDTFVNDIANRLSAILKNDSQDPEYISQAKAYKTFGRANVERWREQGKIEPCKRPGKIEYPMARLRSLSRTLQDYF